MSIYIVTDLGYGDAGKGATVDYLCQNAGTANLVVRHNGGSQAGHNVVLPDGTHHEFSQFGSGTLAGASTFLSRFMLINPLDMELEARHLKEIGVQDVWRHMHIDIEARIVTPYHIAVNRLQEDQRKIDRHGSCGKGIGALMQQDIDRPDLTLHVGDLINGRGHTTERLEYLRRYFIKWLSIRVPTNTSPDWQVLFDSHHSARLADHYHEWLGKVFIVTRGAEWLADQIEYHHNVIFEGAQGVLLDEWHGFHPHTTWSTTTHDNAMTLLDESYQGPVARLGVTRAYMTRHGAGPFVTEADGLNFPEPHNNRGQYQGKFRQGHLDLMMLRYAIDACGGIDGLVVNHLDQADTWKVATSYTIDYYYETHRIDAKRGDHDLVRREKLTNTLKDKASPNYISPAGVSTEDLLAMLGKIAPIYIKSHGPTHADKRVVAHDSALTLTY